jgi:hypothetical protein
MSNTISGQDYLFLPNLTVITMSLANMGMYFEESVTNLLVPALLSAFYNIFHYEKLKIYIGNRTIGYWVIQCVYGFLVIVTDFPWIPMRLGIHVKMTC